MGNPVVTFVHQMIPHHENAINMAKALMMEDQFDCSEEKESDCDMESVLWSIVNEQNHQIATMSSYLDEMGYDEADVCVLCESVLDCPEESPSCECNNPTTNRHLLFGGVGSLTDDCQ